MKKGDKFECKFEVTNEIYTGFIKLFKDNNPLHTDSTFAKEKGFESPVMHGNILNGFVSYFVGECLPVKNVIIQTQQIKFIKPTYLNDIVMFHAEIIEVFESVNMIEIKYTFKNQNLINVATGKLNIGII